MTLRLSSGNKRDGSPNLQNIPSDNETRACFISEKGCIMIDADYSSQEQVLLANASKEENLLNFYRKGFKDMHSYVAFLMYPEIRRCTLEELTPEKLEYVKEEFPKLRYLAKIAGFTVNYGGNGSTISKNCNIPRKDGEFVYTSYFNSFPGLATFFELVFAKTNHFKYIQFNNVTKRKYLFNDSNDYFNLKDTVNDPYFWTVADNPRDLMQKHNKAKSDIQRMSQNFPIQGSAADVTKYACILFFKEILNRGWWKTVKIVNVIHDEILLECPIEMATEVQTILVECMENAGKPFCPIIPLRASALAGDHWVH